MPPWLPMGLKLNPAIPGMESWYVPRTKQTSFNSFYEEKSKSCSLVVCHLCCFPPAISCLSEQAGSWLPRKSSKFIHYSRWLPLAWPSASSTSCRPIDARLILQSSAPVILWVYVCVCASMHTPNLGLRTLEQGPSINGQEFEMEFYTSQVGN